MKLKIIIVIFFAVNALFAQLKLGPFTGAVTPTSAEFIIKTYSKQPVKIELFASDDIAHSIFSKETIAEDSNYNFCKIEVDSLIPNTTYYYRAIVDGYPSKRWHGFKTFASNQRTSFSFGFGSCQQSSYSKWIPEIFPVIAQDSLRFFMQIGDWTYPDTTKKKFGYTYNSKWSLLEKSYEEKYDYNYPFSSEVLSQMPVVYVYDDHDFGWNNSDGSDPFKSNSIKAYEKFFPHYKLANPKNGIWQKFRFGNVEFFVLDLRTQRSPNMEAFDKNGKFNPPPGHSILAGYKIDGENQREWLERSLKESKAEWKVIVSTVIFNPGYRKALDSDTLMKKYPWLKGDIADKWACFPEDAKDILNTIKENDIKNVIVLSGDIHTSFIDDGKNSLLPEICASELDVPNSKMEEILAEGGIHIFDIGSYNGNGHTYGKVSFVFGKKDYAVMQIITNENKIAASYILEAK